VLFVLFALTVLFLFALMVIVLFFIVLFFIVIIVIIVEMALKSFGTIVIGSTLVTDFARGATSAEKQKRQN